MKNKYLKLLGLLLFIVTFIFLYNLRYLDFSYMSKSNKISMLEELGYFVNDEGTFDYQAGSLDDYSSSNLMFNYIINDSTKVKTDDIVSLESLNHEYRYTFKTDVINIDGVDCYSRDLTFVPTELSNPTCVAIDPDNLELNTFKAELDYIINFENEEYKAKRNDEILDDFEHMTVENKKERLLTLGYIASNNELEYMYKTGSNDSYPDTNLIINYVINDNKKLGSSDMIYLTDHLNQQIRYNKKDQTIAIDGVVCFKNVDEIQPTMVNSNECYSKDVNTSYVEVLMSEQKYIFSDNYYKDYPRKLFKMESYVN
jgi:hypothetical protein